MRTELRTATTIFGPVPSGLEGASQTEAETLDPEILDPNALDPETPTPSTLDSRPLAHTG